MSGCGAPMRSCASASAGEGSVSARAKTASAPKAADLARRITPALNCWEVATRPRHAQDLARVGLEAVVVAARMHDADKARLLHLHLDGAGSAADHVDLAQLRRRSAVLTRCRPHAVYVEGELDARHAHVLVPGLAPVVVDDADRVQVRQRALGVVADEVCAQLESAREGASAIRLGAEYGVQCRARRARLQHGDIRLGLGRAAHEARTHAQEGARRQVGAKRVAVTDVAVVQVHLWEGVAELWADWHRIDPVCAKRTARVRLEAAAGVGLAEAGPCSREGDNVVVIVGGDGLARAVEHARAVLVELPQTDREELHDLTRVKEVAEGVAHKDVVEGDPALRAQVFARPNHDDLRKRECHPLAQLVGRTDGDVVVHHLPERTHGDDGPIQVIQGLAVARR
eukprot:scaffold12244_cov216-Isochrysis_galbana.AAC.9